jgi:Type II secretion system (T2SS), protein E, N-terminal domain
MIVGLDEKRTQHAGSAFDVNSSLIYIEATGGPPQALQLAARRMSSQVRYSDSVVFLESACALLLPATPFSGAQALAERLAPFLTDVLYDLQVYHGATALLILQHLHESGARTLSRLEPPEARIPAAPGKAQAFPEGKKPAPAHALPYLAFLANYPSPRLLHLFPYELACRYQCVPVGVERNMLTLATCNRLNRDIVTQLRSATRRGIFQVRCEISVIDEVLCYWRRFQEGTERAGGGASGFHARAETVQSPLPDGWIVDWSVLYVADDDYWNWWIRC